MRRKKSFIHLFDLADTLCRSSRLIMHKANNKVKNERLVSDLASSFILGTKLYRWHLHASKRRKPQVVERLAIQREQVKTRISDILVWWVMRLVRYVPATPFTAYTSRHMSHRRFLETKRTARLKFSSPSDATAYFGNSTYKINIL